MQWNDYQQYFCTDTFLRLNSRSLTFKGQRQPFQKLRWIQSESRLDVFSDLKLVLNVSLIEIKRVFFKKSGAFSFGLTSFWEGWHSPLIFTNRKALEHNRSSTQYPKKTPKNNYKKAIQLFRNQKKKKREKVCVWKWADAWCPTMWSWKQTLTLQLTWKSPNTLCVFLPVQSVQTRSGSHGGKITGVKLFQVKGNYRSKSRQIKELMLHPSFDFLLGKMQRISPFSLKYQFDVSQPLKAPNCRVAGLHFYFKLFMIPPKNAWKANFWTQNCTNTF